MAEGEVARLSEADIEQRFAELFREVFDDPHLKITSATTAHDIKGWDSAKMVDLISAVEFRFGVRFANREIDGLDCVGDFIALLRRKSPASGVR